MKSEIKLKLLLIIVQTEESERLQTLLDGYGFRGQTAGLGEGTARSETLAILGLAGAQKTLHYTVGEEALVYRALAEISAEMKFEQAGGGVGMILPLTSVCGRQTFNFLLGGNNNGK